MQGTTIQTLVCLKIKQITNLLRGSGAIKATPRVALADEKSLQDREHASAE